MIFATGIMSIFNTDAGFLAEGTRALRIYSLAFFTIGGVQILSAFFQGIGKGFPALILGVARWLVLLVPCLLILVYFFGLPGIWMAFPVSDVLALIIAIIWTRSEFHKLGIPFNLRSNQRALQDIEINKV